MVSTFFRSSASGYAAVRLDGRAYGVDEYKREHHASVADTSAKVITDVVSAVTTEPLKPIASNDARPALSGQPSLMQKAAAYIANINWLHFTLLCGTPLLAAYGLATTKLTRPTLLWSVIYYFYSALGITAGYHRLWAHRAYSATLPLRVFLIYGGSAAVQGSLRWWARDHRAHHRYTDSDKDPYSAHKGLWHSHMGWMLQKQDPKKIGRADISDLNADPFIRFQHRYYLYFALIFGFVLPTVVAGLGWGDWKGGFFYAAILRLVFVHHATFCVNSLAHYLGERTYDDRHTPCDHLITALVTVGEGYHNFHHEFPSDFRNAIKYYQYDPTKWFILAMSLVGLAYNLQYFPHNEIAKGAAMIQEKQIISRKKQLDWGVAVGDLKAYTWEEVTAAVKEDKAEWIVISGIVHDVADFDHPGGKAFLKSGFGKDMTEAFNGGVYDHSNAARNLLQSMRVGVVHDKFQ